MGKIFYWMPLTLSNLSLILLRPLLIVSAMNYSVFLCSSNSLGILEFNKNKATPTTVSGWHASSSVWTPSTICKASSLSSVGYLRSSVNLGIRLWGEFPLLNQSLNTFWRFFLAYFKDCSSQSFLSSVDAS